MVSVEIAFLLESAVVECFGTCEKELEENMRPPEEHQETWLGSAY